MLVEPSLNHPNLCSLLILWVFHTIDIGLILFPCNRNINTFNKTLMTKLNILFCYYYRGFPCRLVLSWARQILNWGTHTGCLQRYLCFFWDFYFVNYDCDIPFWLLILLSLCFFMSRRLRLGSMELIKSLNMMNTSCVRRYYKPCICYSIFYGTIIY